jgi:type II secretory pathway component PulC
MTPFRHFPLIAALPLFWTLQLGIATAQAQDQAGAVLDNPLAVHSLDRMSATRERPVFSPSRRPPAPPPQPIVQLPSPSPPPAPPNMSLFGVVLEANEARAVVRIAPKNDIVRLRVGEEIGGWKVTQIERRRLVLSLDDRSATFTLFDGQGPKPPIGRPASRAVDRQMPIQLQPPILAPR